MPTTAPRIADRLHAAIEAHAAATEAESRRQALALRLWIADQEDSLRRNGAAIVVLLAPAANPLPPRATPQTRRVATIRLVDLLADELRRRGHIIDIHTRTGAQIGDAGAERVWVLREVTREPVDA